MRELNENSLSNYGTDCVEKVITKGMDKFKNEIKSSWREDKKEAAPLIQKQINFINLITPPKII